MSFEWSPHFWFVIERIFRQKRDNRLEALRVVGEYIPCGKCKTHYLRFLEERPMDGGWLDALKNDIKQTKKKGCCNKKGFYTPKEGTIQKSGLIY